uniref:Uncharacterized protein n=1 Tax=Cacopsylla melanoneura TaxID=428564 RepID=A0A8D8XDL0_9HEMI
MGASGAPGPNIYHCNSSTKYTRFQGLVEPSPMTMMLLLVMVMIRRHQVLSHPLVRRAKMLPSQIKTTITSRVPSTRNGGVKHWRCPESRKVMVPLPPKW